MGGPLDIRFFVAGKPIAKGNHDAFPIDKGPCEKCKAGPKCGRKNCIGGHLVGTTVTDDGGKELESWQSFVRVHAMSARNAAGARLVERPDALEISMIFLRSRPESHYTTKGALSAEGMKYALPTTKPDWDKCARAVGDAITGATKKGLVGVLAEDDSQICVAQVAKSFTDGREGVAIRARQVGSDPDWVLAELAQLGLRAPTRQGALL